VVVHEALSTGEPPPGPGGFAARREAHPEPEGDPCRTTRIAAVPVFGVGALPRVVALAVRTGEVGGQPQHVEISGLERPARVGLGEQRARIAPGALPERGTAGGEWVTHGARVAPTAARAKPADRPSAWRGPASRRAHA